MPNKTIKFLLEEVATLRKTLNDHLIESGSIKSSLKWNTWLTGGIAMGILTRAFMDYLKR